MIAVYVRATVVTGQSVFEYNLSDWRVDMMKGLFGQHIG